MTKAFIQSQLVSTGKILEDGKLNVTATTTERGGVKIDGVTIATNANGQIYTVGSGVTNVMYVSKSGSDTNSGNSLTSSKLTIKSALATASYGTTIFVKSGDYTENNPMTVPAGVAVVGDSLRTVTVRPLNKTQDLFWVNNASYLTHMTFKDHESPSAAVAFNPNGSAGVINTSPYVQNCTSMTTTGAGMRVNGAHASGLRSMVVDAYTQYNQGGIGIHMLNKGNAQLVSVFTICCTVGFLCESGGFCSITNSNSSFGNYALKSDGVSSVLYTGRVVGTTAGSTFVINNLTTRPNVGDAVLFADNTTYYTVASSTELIDSSSTVILEESVSTTINNNSIVNFYQFSRITAAGHTFEWIGSGTDINTALPYLGGTAITANQAVTLNQGKIFFTGTDQRGDFRIGNDFVINQNTGTITGRTFTKSLFAVMTPYILAIGS